MGRKVGCGVKMTLSLWNARKGFLQESAASSETSLIDAMTFRKATLHVRFLSGIYLMGWVSDVHQVEIQK